MINSLVTVLREAERREPHSPTCHHGKKTTYGGTGEWPDYSPPWVMTGIGCDCDRLARFLEGVARATAGEPDL